MLGATNVVITSEWSSIVLLVHNTQMTDVTESGRGCCRWVSKLLPLTDILAVQTAKPAARA